MESTNIPYECLQRLQRLHEDIPYLKAELTRQEILHSSKCRSVARLKLLTAYTLPQQLATLKELAHKIDQISDTVKDNKSKRAIHDGLMKEVSQQQDGLTDLLLQWDTAFRAIRASESAPEGPSFMDSIDAPSSQAIITFLSCILSSSASSVMAHSLMQKQGSDLLRLPTALRPYLILLVEAKGVLACANFMEILLGMAIEELEALELADAHTSRQRELEAVVIGLLEQCEGLKLEVPVKAPTAKDPFVPSRGPFHLGLEFQQVLLEILDEGRKIRAFVKSTSTGQVEEKSSRTSQESPSFWHETGSTIMGISNSIISTPGHLIASTFMSRQTPSQQSTTGLPQQTKELKAKYDLLHTRSAVALLQALTPAETEQQIPLQLYLIRRLLQNQFPSDSRPTAHRRALLLLVIRYYGFTYLSYILSRLGSGDILDGVHISRQDSTDLILPLHRRAYMALIDATGFTADGVENRFVKELLSDAGGPNQTSFVNGLRTLRIASRAFLSSFLAIVQPAEELQIQVERSFAINRTGLLELWEALGSAVPLSSTVNASSPPSASYAPFDRPPFSFKTRTTSSETIPRTQQGSRQSDAQQPSGDLHAEIREAMTDLKATRNTDSSESEWSLFFFDAKGLSKQTRVSRSSKVSLLADTPDSSTAATTTSSEDPFLTSTGQTPAPKAAQGSIISWGRKPKSLSTPILLKPAGGLKDAETVLFARVLKYSFTNLNADCRSGDDLPSCLWRMLGQARDRQDFEAVSSLSQACQKLSSFAQDRPQLLTEGASAVMQAVLAPSDIEVNLIKHTIDAYTSALSRLRSTCTRLLPAARHWLSLLDNIRTRIYYLDQQIDAYPMLLATVDRINDGSRSQENRKAVFQLFRSWVDANQVHEFMPFSAAAEDEAESEFAEVLMHVDREACKMSEVEDLSTFFNRESAQLKSFERNMARSERNAPAPANSPNPMTFVLANSSQMIDRFGKMLPQKDVPRAAANIHGPFVFLECGAVPSAFIQQSDSCSNPSTAIDSWKLRVQLRLSGYLASHLHSDSHLTFDSLGSDAWFESYSVPKKALSPALQSIGNLTSTFLRRFTLHPSPVLKNAALADLEQVLVGALLMEKAPKQADPPSYFRRVSVSLTRRTSYLQDGPSSPTRKGRHAVPDQSEGSAGGEAPSVPATTPGLDSFIEKPFTSQAARSPAAVEQPSTDVILNNLEPIILSVRPPHLFVRREPHEFQIVG